MTFCFVVISLCTFGLNGCKSPTSQLPQVLGENPTLAQIQQAINQNSEKI
ncbi:MAG: hypothetical protein IKW74_04360 [Thermoguttaceae bacterium]|nr:hypothetical protein [Thermoguttaceae bacterium]